jgi:acyl-homoserine lactone acylase PvdQ
MGPQVGYYSPEILMELDLHGPGIDARGVTLPGIAFLIIMGRGPDFAWSATSATTDDTDLFAERLCEPGGGRPTTASVHYLYRGRCVPLRAATTSCT